MNLNFQRNCFKLCAMIIWSFLICFALACCSGGSSASAAPPTLPPNFTLSVVPATSDNLPGIQSFAEGSVESYEVIVGGLTQGIHTFSSWSAYNRNLIILNISTNTLVASIPLSAMNLSASIQLHLSSTNAQHIQQGNYLYYIGGLGLESYGPNESNVTYSYITQINLESIVSAVINNESPSTFSAYFNQIDGGSAFEITGGRANIMNDYYYLCFGQDFDIDYTPTSEGVYSNKVVQFQIQDEPFALKNVNSYPESGVRRRDYNLYPITDNGVQQLLVGAGPFDETGLLNYNPIQLSVNPDNSINFYKFPQIQKFNQYEAAFASLYSKKNNTNYLLTFGGISLSYLSNSYQIITDPKAPLSNVISLFSVKNGTYWGEYYDNQIFEPVNLKYNVPMYYGTDTAFIKNPDLQLLPNGQIDLDAITAQTFIGYMYGGISSTSNSIILSGVQSIASNQVYKVYITPGNAGSNWIAY